jgi:formate dehydrogenase subunit delta
MHQDNLVRMANDIGNFFRGAVPREEAIEAIAAHIAKFWTRKMQAKLVAEAKLADCGLDELPLAAAGRLAQQQDDRAVVLHPPLTDG